MDMNYNKIQKQKCMEKYLIMNKFILVKRKRRFEFEKISKSYYINDNAIIAHFYYINYDIYI